MFKAFFYYFKAFKFFRKWWMWKYALWATANFIFVTLITVAIFIGILATITPWAQNVQLHPTINKSIIIFLDGLEHTYHISLPKQKPFVNFIQIMGFFCGIVFGLGLQEIINCPIYKKISSRVERNIFGKLSPKNKKIPIGYFQEIGRNIWGIFIRSPIIILIFFVLFVLSCIPHLGLAITPLITCYIMGKYYIGYGNANFSLPNVNKKKHFYNFMLHLVFGGICFINIGVCFYFYQPFLLPLISLIFNPLQVAAGTMLCHVIYTTKGVIQKK